MLDGDAKSKLTPDPRQNSDGVTLLGRVLAKTAIHRNVGQAVVAMRKDQDIERHVLLAEPGPTGLTGKDDWQGQTASR